MVRRKQGEEVRPRPFLRGVLRNRLTEKANGSEEVDALVKITNVTLKKADDNSEAKARAKAAEQRKKSAEETIEDAWTRILAMNNSATDAQRLREVKRAMEAGEIGREPVPEGKRQGKFSKAEALRLYKELAEKQREGKLREMVENTPDNYVLVTDKDALSEAIDALSREELIVFDVETTGVNVYSDIIVGHVLSAVSADTHYYIPTDHDDDSPQLDRDYVAEQLRPIYENPSIGFIAHNAK